MRAIILAGGEGTRLRPYTFAIPKPLLPIEETPILEIVINKLKSFGINDIILAVGYRAELIKAYFQDGSKLGIKIDYYEEKEKKGTAGALKEIKNKFNINEPVLVMNGDIITNLDFNKLIQFHKENNSDITVCTRKFKLKSPFGVIRLNDKKIIDIEEKPVIEQDASSGIYIINPEVMDLIPETRFDMPDLIRASIKNNKNALSYFITEYWLAVDKQEQLIQAIDDKDKWKI